MSAVGHAVWIGSAPLPVEVTNHTEWWVQWLPLAAAALVAMATLIGVILSNKTTLKVSRQQREGDRQRDYLQWRREELRRLGTEVVEAAVEAMDEFSKMATVDSEKPIVPAAVEPIDRACRRIAANGEALRLLSAPVTAERCEVLRNSIIDEELMKIAREYHEALGRDTEAGLLYEEISEVTAEIKARFEQRLGRVHDALRGVGQAAESALRQLNPPN